MLCPNPSFFELFWIFLNFPEISRNFLNFPEFPEIGHDWCIKSSAFCGEPHKKELRTRRESHDCQEGEDFVLTSQTVW